MKAKKTPANKSKSPQKQASKSTKKKAAKSLGKQAAKVRNQLAAQSDRRRYRGDALQKLAKASSNEVAAQNEGIAKSLVKHAIKGDMNCAKLLLALIEKLPPRKRKYRSIADEWANSPQWKDPEGDEEIKDEETDKMLADMLESIKQESTQPLH